MNLKKLFLAVAAFAAMSVIAGARESLASKDTVRILSIGNSFSVDAVEQNLWDLGHEDGRVLIIGNMYIGGCSLARHLRNIKGDIADYSYRKIVDGVKTQTKAMTLDKAISDEKWDVVSVQQASPYSGIYATLEKDLPPVASYVREKAPQAELVFHMTWAYAKNSTHSAFVNYRFDQGRMYWSIVDASRRAARLVKIHTVIPAGTAIQNARTSVIGDTMNRDGYHLQLTYGRYTAALTWYAELFGRDVRGMKYAPEGISDQYRDICQRAAMAAVRHPWKITRM